MLNKILIAIDSVESTTKEEQLLKLEVEMLIIKMYESDKIHEENLKILDEYADNGMKSHRQKKFTK